MKHVKAALIIVCFGAGAMMPLTANADELVIVSDTSVEVYGPLSAYASVGDAAWGSANAAVATWVHGSWPSIADATWISTSYYIGQDGGSIPNSSWRLFHDDFTIPAGAYNISATLTITSDNAEEVYLNGVFVDSDGEVQGSPVDNHEWSTVIDLSLTPQAGANSLDIIVRNYPGSSSATGNPTGLIFKLVINYDLPLGIDVDVKPGSFPNSMNINGNGVVPVAILGSSTFDVSQIDVSTLCFAGLEVRVRGNGQPQCSIKDVSGDFSGGPEGAPDGYPDLVCQFVDDPTLWDVNQGTAILTGNLLDGTPFQGSDSINVVNE